jgi:hypothetical protein
MMRRLPEMPTPETEVDRRLLDDIETQGWHVIRVPPRGNTPGWAFSVGLHHRFAHPEIIVFGLPMEALHNLVDRVASGVAGGGRYPSGSTSDQILEGYTCGMRPVMRRWYQAFLGYAVWFYGDDEFPVVQCRWPDRENRLPEHPDFDVELANLQPFLEHESTKQAGVEALLHSLDVL